MGNTPTLFSGCFSKKSLYHLLISASKFFCKIKTYLMEWIRNRCRGTFSQHQVHLIPWLLLYSFMEIMEWSIYGMQKFCVNKYKTESWCQIYHCNYQCLVFLYLSKAWDLIQFISVLVDMRCICRQTLPAFRQHAASRFKTMTFAISSIIDCIPKSWKSLKCKLIFLVELCQGFTLLLNRY